MQRFHAKLMLANLNAYRERAGDPPDNRLSESAILHRTEERAEYLRKLEEYADRLLILADYGAEKLEP